jgi:predicted DNA-binding transcriptional regulator AlpA
MTIPVSALALSLSSAPDFALLSKQQLCDALGISRNNFDSIEARGEAPPRVQLSERRYGYAVGSVREWIAKRTEQPAAQAA